MSSLETAATRLAFDDILEAVQESKRGRWFLQEYEARLRQKDSASVLDAITRLEARMGNMTGAAPDELGKVRIAISNARSDLLRLGLGKQALSEEGRMFGQLAELARKVIPAESAPTIVRGLQLVEEIERTVVPAGNTRGANYFAADAQIFEKPSAPPKPVLVEKIEPTVQSKKSEDAPTTGAKLVIRKSTATVDPSPAIAAEPIAVAVPEIKVEQPEQDHPRISIVRRKPEDMPEVADDSATAA